MGPQIRPVTRSQRSRLSRESTKTEKILAARNVIGKRWTYKVAAKKMGCAASTIHRWVKQLNNGQCMHEKGGKPAFLSPELKLKVIAEVTGTGSSSVKMSKRKFSKLMQDAADSTSRSQNKPRKPLSSRYLRDFGMKNDINEGNAEVIDNAHLVALNDPRHALSFAVMHKFLRGRVHKGLFVTFDKTRFDMPKSQQQKARAVYLAKRPQTFKCAQPNNKNSQGNCSVQLFLVISDGGKVADMVYLVKDKSMTKDAIDVHCAQYERVHRPWSHSLHHFCRGILSE